MTSSKGPAMFFCAAMLTAASAGADTLPLQTVASAALPGAATRLDYQSLDPARHLLFIAHLGDGAIVVFDTKLRRVVATIPDVAAVHGVLAVPALNTLYASATGTNELLAIDERTFRIKWRAAAGVYPDGIAYDPGTNHVFVSDEHAGTDTVIDAARGKRIAAIPLGGEVGNTQYDPVSRHMFVNAEGMGQLVEIDPRNNRIVNRTALPGCKGNHGLLIDFARRRAFIACEENATLLWLDMRTMRIRSIWKIGADPDVLALDTRNGIVYVAAEGGVVSLFEDTRSVRLLAQGFLAPAAHTVCVDPKTNLTFWPLENSGGRPAIRIMRFTGRTFRQ